MPDQGLKPRRRLGVRPLCETVMPATYFHRAYRVRDNICLPQRWLGDIVDVGHLDGGYCLDRAEPATGSHRCGDFIYKA